MNSKKILVVLLVVVGLALVLGGCKDTGSSVGGTVTIMLTGAGVAEGEDFYAGIFVSLEDLEETDESLAGDTAAIAGGVASIVIELVPAGTYQLGAFIDVNGSGDYEYGDPLLSGVIFTVNGDTTVTVDYADFDVPLPS